MHPTATDPASVAFVVQCFLLQAVDADELRSWAEHALVAGEDCPMFVEGLAEFDGQGDQVFRILGFVPERTFTEQERAAITAIAAARGRIAREDSAPRPDLCTTLEQNSETVSEFRRVFGFLELSAAADLGVTQTG